MFSLLALLAPESLGKAVEIVLSRNLHLLADQEKWPAILHRPIRELSETELREFLHVILYFELHGVFPPVAT